MCVNAYTHTNMCMYVHVLAQYAWKPEDNFWGNRTQVTKLGGKHLTVEASCRLPLTFENTCIWERGIPNIRCCQPLMEEAQTEEGCCAGVASVAPSFLLLASSETGDCYVVRTNLVLSSTPRLNNNPTSVSPVRPSHMLLYLIFPQLTLKLDCSTRVHYFLFFIFIIIFFSGNGVGSRRV